MTRAGVIALVAAAAASAWAPAAAAPVVYYPPDNLTVSGRGLLHVVGEVGGSDAPRMDIAVEGGTLDKAWAVSRTPGNPVLHGRLQLAPGMNVLVIAFRDGTRELTTVTRRVFFEVPTARTSEPPPGFGRRPFHRSGAEPVCEGCHRMVPEPDDGGPPAPQRSTCYSCHAGLTAGKEVHGPTAQWACTRCHDPSGPERYATPYPVLPLCFSCHSDLKRAFYGNRYQHGPTATGRCTICHDPHSTEHQFFLKKPPWHLCTTCHFEKGSGRHVISWGPNGQGHPTRGKPDPTRPGIELSCASCHNPHAAPAPKLWKFGATLWLELCKNCHGALLGG